MNGASLPIATTARASTGRYLLLSRLALVLFLAALGTLLWLNDKADRDEQQATLISDVLWLDQNVQFALTRDGERLQQLALDLPGGSAARQRFELDARYFLGDGSGMRRVLWRGGDGRVIAAMPPRSEAAAAGDDRGGPSASEAFRLAAALGKPAYSGSYAADGGDWQFEVDVPMFRGQHLDGMLVGVYSVKAVLQDLVPWWLTQRYRISVIDSDGYVLGAKTAVRGTTPGPSYQIPFDPPGHGMILRATAYEQDTNLARNILAAAIVGLALAVLWSLWVLRRHIQRRQQAEAALREEYAFRRAMEDSLDTGLRARDLDGRITYVNPAFCRMVGWSAGELVGMTPPMPYWVPEQIEQTQRIHDDVLAGQIPGEGIEIRLQRRNGEQFDALIHEAPLIDAEGQHRGWMGSVIDISERKRSEEFSRQQEARLQATARLVAMGEMASSLAHELNQPLAAIAGYSAGMLNELRSGELAPQELESTLDKVGRQAQRAGQVIRRIYDFVRRHKPRQEVCDVGGIVEDAIGLVEADAKRHNISVERRIETPLPTIQGDPVLLGQVLVNLLRNGIEAMLEPEAQQRILSVEATAAADGVHIVVSDTGHGLDPARAEKLFEPFFTTKSEGMGMGLNICRTIVENHRGRLWFEANPGGGSRFHVHLPASPAAHD